MIEIHTLGLLVGKGLANVILFIKYGSIYLFEMANFVEIIYVLIFPYLLIH
jgi:hypothetical protein